MKNIGKNDGYISAEKYWVKLQKETSKFFPLSFSKSKGPQFEIVHQKKIENWQVCHKEKF